jgi:hypothetical protein
MKKGGYAKAPHEISLTALGKRNSPGKTQNLVGIPLAAEPAGRHFDARGAALGVRKPVRATPVSAAPAEGWSARH